jgi:hypothetical protein
MIELAAVPIRRGTEIKKIQIFKYSDIQICRLSFLAGQKGVGPWRIRQRLRNKELAKTVNYEEAQPLPAKDAYYLRMAQLEIKQHAKSRETLDGRAGASGARGENRLAENNSRTDWNYLIGAIAMRQSAFQPSGSQRRPGSLTIEAFFCQIALQIELLIVFGCE